jgi:hypothetical protein
MTPKTARVVMRQSLDICGTGLLSGAVAAVVVAPFNVLGFAWGTAIVATAMLALVIALMVRSYNQILLFAMRRRAGSPGARDAAVLTELFEEFAAEGRADGHGTRGVIDVWPLRLSKWLAASRHLGVGERAMRSAGH